VRRVVSSCAAGAVVSLVLLGACHVSAQTLPTDHPRRFTPSRDLDRPFALSPRCRLSQSFRTPVGVPVAVFLDCLLALSGLRSSPRVFAPVLHSVHYASSTATLLLQ
jgi:hypothetical protein